MKKTIAFMAAFVLMVSMLPMAVLAANPEGTEIESISLTDAFYDPSVGDSIEECFGLTFNMSPENAAVQTNVIWMREMQSQVAADSPIESGVDYDAVITFTANEGFFFDGATIFSNNLQNKFGSAVEVLNEATGYDLNGDGAFQICVQFTGTTETKLRVRKADPAEATVTLNEKTHVAISLNNEFSGTGYSIQVTGDANQTIAKFESYNESMDHKSFDLEILGVSEGTETLTFRILKDGSPDPVSSKSFTVTVISGADYSTSATLTSSHNPIYGQTLAQFKAAGDPPTATVFPENSAESQPSAVAFYKTDANGQWTVMSDTDVFTEGAAYKDVRKITAAEGYVFSDDFQVIFDGKIYKGTLLDEKTFTFEHPLTPTAASAQAPVSKAPATGDGTNAMLYFMILVAMAACTGVTVFASKKRK